MAVRSSHFRLSLVVSVMSTATLEKEEAVVTTLTSIGRGRQPPSRIVHLESVRIVF